MPASSLVKYSFYITFNTYDYRSLVLGLFESLMNITFH